MSTWSWVRRVGAAVAAGCVLASPVGGSAATASVAAVPSTPWAWGDNGFGQLGDGSTIQRNAPVPVGGLSGVTTIAGGGYHSLAVKSDGTVWAWGLNLYGELGNGTTTNSSTPVPVSGLTGVTAIAAGFYHSLAVKSDSTVWAWGLNQNGQLGNGTTTSSSIPVPVSGLSGAIAVASGQYHSLALKSDGTVWAWGYNGFGQLGNGITGGSSSTPVQVSGLSGATGIAGGQDHSLALKSDGTAWAWGYNFWGQLGNGTTTNSSTVVQVSGLGGVTAIAGGLAHSLAVKSDGTVWAWGYNIYGQLGNGTTTSSSTPVQVSGLSGVAAIAGGGQHSLALKSDGTVRAWGRNIAGQLGTGTPGGISSTPVAVIGLSGVTAIAGGAAHSLALSSPPSCPAAGATPATERASSTNQYTLSNSDGAAWQEMDAARLRVYCTPTAIQSVLVTANADLWTANAGFNQDLGIFVSDNGSTDQLLAWKESGGFAGTFSPNAAYVQTRYSMTNGHAYVFKLKWKTNKPATGVTIVAAAGNGPVFSPTSLVAETFPTGAVPNFAVSSTQYTLASSDGVTWQNIDAAHLSTTLSPTATATAVLGGNVDLWTANAGFNQDIGIFVSDNAGPDSLVAWKESGGFAGTFSPNAAFVEGTYAMTASHTYVFTLKWKTNKPASGATIVAAAGNGPVFSPTGLVAESIAAGANPYTAVSTNQYALPNSDGVTWRTIDSALNVTVAPGAGTNSIIDANADLWTANAGYNQDIGIFVSDNGGLDVLLAWKESGGFAGTFSPNAAFSQTTYQMTAAHTYVFKLKWKTNKNAPGATIFAAAGHPPTFSPTRLTVDLMN
ncbi:MAG: RCC1 repeat-containing protein [Chloroflexi bacterium]|nr:MAG: RCC1 repeat-containing protein [Chloroflexota bacterium]